jgi:hypothetical protein
MGTLYYGSSRTPITIDDRILAHLRVVTGSKLRRSEPFMLSWNESADEGHGRSSVWIHPNLDLIYRFDGGHSPDLDSTLLDEMSNAALSPTGVQIDASMSRFWGR